ncbi:hypothetical protein FAIPA1_230081 [Frankia sp. AiPs1]
MHAIVGGTPAYRREFARDDTPASPDDFDAWVTRTVLSPTSALFLEGRYLLADEPDLRTTPRRNGSVLPLSAGSRRGSSTTRPLVPAISSTSSPSASRTTRNRSAC